MSFSIQNLLQSFSPVRMEFSWGFPEVATTPQLNVERGHQACLASDSAATLNGRYVIVRSNFDLNGWLVSMEERLERLNARLEYFEHLTAWRERQLALARAREQKDKTANLKRFNVESPEKE